MQIEIKDGLVVDLTEDELKELAVTVHRALYYEEEEIEDEA
jgi:hypothetical protein